MFLLSQLQTPLEIVFRVFAVITALSFPTPCTSLTPEKIIVGVLRFTSSGPVFLAQDSGYFRDAGLDVEIAVFQDAPSMAAAAAAGKVTFGVGALTAATYNLGAANQLLILAGQAREEKGYSGNQILVTKAAHDRGFNSIDMLMSERFGLTQAGSPSHYQLGQLANARGITVSDLNIVALQTLPNLVAALQSGAISWAIIAPPIATDLIESGTVLSLGPYSDHGSYQFGGVVASSALLESHVAMVKQFLAAYRRGLVEYSSIVLDPDSKSAQEAARVVGRHVYPDLSTEAAATKVIASALYVDPTGHIDVADVERQIKWYHANGMLKSVPAVKDLIRLDLLP